jgi:hypothetical protein
MRALEDQEMFYDRVNLIEFYDPLQGEIPASAHHNTRTFLHEQRPMFEVF